LNGFYLVGNIVIDNKINQDGSVTTSTGGPPSFSSYYLYHAKKTAKVVSCNPDKLTEVDPELKLILDETGPHYFTPSQDFTRFTLDYSIDRDGSIGRHLFLISFPGIINPGFVDHLQRNSTVILCPVYHEITLELIKKLSTREDLFLAIDPQGFLRQIGKDKRIYMNDLPENFPFQPFSVIKLSSEDLSTTLSNNPHIFRRKIKNMIKDPNKIILITMGEKGAIAIRNDRLIQVRALSSRAIDETGAGDVFLSAFVDSFIEKNHLGTALKIATAASSCLIEKQGIKGTENHQEILRRAKNCEIEEFRETSTSDIMNKLTSTLP
jgi:hypothetical protein